LKSKIGQIHRTEYEIEDRRAVPVVICGAPGRIHFLGEQGEKQSGFFLSAAINRRIHLAVSSRNDNSFRFYAVDLQERKRSVPANLKYRREDRWANYLKTAIFLFIELGYLVKGLNISFYGDIPQNAGFASSSAIETAAAAALRSLFKAPISDFDLAQKLTEAHLKLFNSPAALIDYQICLMARKDQFLVFVNSSADIKKLDSPLSCFRILIVDSHAPHLGAESELASRRSDSLKGLEYLSRKRQGSGFNDFASADLLEALGDFPEHIRRRSLHIVEEIRRVNDAADAIERRDIASFAKIIFHSHESLRDLYEVSCPEVDWFVKRAAEMEGVAGSRMTGLGFGCCTYTIIRKELVEEYKRRLEEYERIFGFRPEIFEVKLDAGVKIVRERRGVNANTAH
jgi:galactokinase